MSGILQGTPSPMKIREELEQMVLADLLGPTDGQEEELADVRPRDRYLIGMLAPKRQDLTPEEFDELPQGGAGNIEDGPVEYTAPTARTMFPSSFGMTFCVGLEAESLRIAAHWGHYSRERSGTLTDEKTGQAKLVWKRKPRGGASDPVALKPGKMTPWVPDPEFPEVQVQGLMRKRDHFWSVTLFLVNGQDEPSRSRDAAWLFQPELAVESPDGRAIFYSRPVERRPGKSDPALFAEDQELAMLYRHEVEFGAGHGVGIHAERPPGVFDRALRISTTVAPVAEVRKSTPPTVAELPGLQGLTLDMKELGQTATADFEAKLNPLLSAYANWIAGLNDHELDSPEMSAHKPAGKAALDRCRRTLERIREGIDLLTKSETAADAFRFANLAMWQQRVHTIYSEKRRRDEKVDITDLDVPANRSWYPFQLAFVLLNLPGITELDHPDRVGGPDAVADLLWFPTGGGKTEAYLGLTAYTVAIRRLQVSSGSADGPWSRSSSGVAVLMRYTLRLLTIQQFQRATALICACELLRRQDDAKWGTEPFRVGLWVGQRTTPNTTEQSAESIQQQHGQRGFKGRGAGSPAQLTNCPWCGSKIDPGRDIKVETYSKGRSRTLTYCSDPMGTCPFTARQSAAEGIPVLVVDEEIYRRLPALLIATVDKFAQMPWNGKVEMLFGQVDSYCDRHGFRSPEIDDADSHPKRDRMPAAKTIARSPLRPPDLIIQDELHLISGPLGTLVGLYETAVDKLCSWEVNGKVVRPKVIASTATIRKAGDQVHATFLRKVNVFPPNGLDVRDNFFSVQREPSEETPGRRYIGICAPGRRLKVALIRTYVALLSAGQALYEKKGYGKHADPWMTLVGYFNSMRELGGMRRLVDDDVRTRLGKMDQRGLAKRALYSVDELTSRKDSTDIPQVLDHLESGFDPANEARRKGLLQRGLTKDLPQRPLDVLLATNMVSVGVDVPRLGLMVVGGQPKTTAEYIQATSRVGRRYPGLVFTVYNWARPRDLSHYETFEHYHATFYKHVEPLSVTPFSLGAINRGLTALMVSCIRHRGAEFNENKRASRIDRNHPYVQEAIEAIVSRAVQVGKRAEVESLVRAELNGRLDQWLAEAQNTAGGRVLGYDDERDGLTLGMLRRPSLEPWDDFTCLNSLRDVEPTVGLIFNDGGLDEDSTFVPTVSEDSEGDEGDQEGDGQ